MEINQKTISTVVRGMEASVNTCSLVRLACSKFDYDNAILKIKVISP